jgi:hypothetical protein
MPFLPAYSHSFRIIVIPSVLVSFVLNYCHFKYLSSWIAPVPSHTRQSWPYWCVQFGFKNHLLKTQMSKNMNIPSGWTSTHYDTPLRPAFFIKLRFHMLFKRRILGEWIGEEVVVCEEKVYSLSIFFFSFFLCKWIKCAFWIQFLRWKKISLQANIGTVIDGYRMIHRYWANPFPYSGTWTRTQEPGPVLRNLDPYLEPGPKEIPTMGPVLGNLDPYLGTRTRFCTQKLAQYWLR